MWIGMMAVIGTMVVGVHLRKSSSPREKFCRVSSPEPNRQLSGPIINIAIMGQAEQPSCHHCGLT
jgi:hypothetical protein